MTEFAFSPLDILQSYPQIQPIRCITTTETGAIMSKPSTVRFGLPKVLVILAPLMYLGATISKEGAAFLEENDIFIPDDDDD